MKFVNTGSIADRQRSAKPMKSTERDRRRMCMKANKAQFLSEREHGGSSDLIPKVSFIMYAFTYSSVGCVFKSAQGSYFYQISK